MQGSLRSGVALAAIGGATVLSAALGAAVTRRNRAWYRRLRKSPLNPPGGWFGPVWTVLYGLSALSAARIHAAPASSGRSRALAFWGLQHALNAAWTPLFFGWHRPRAALVDLVSLWASLGAYWRAARRVDPLAARLVMPYLGWVSFAAYLNEEVLRRNPRRLQNG